MWFSILSPHWRNRRVRQENIAKQIRKRIMEVKSKITDEEFFASKAYRAYLMDITESATGAISSR